MGLNSITLQSNDSDVISGDIVGRINWAAASDGDGPVATSIAASISAVAEETFNDSNNATSLIFSTANDSNASEKLKITSGGHLLPFADSSYDLGSDNFYFRSIYADKYYGDIDGPIVVECRNDTGSTISKGSPVYISGYYSNNGKPQIAPSNAASASTMPAIGILANELTDGSEGHVHCFGLVTQINTSSFSVGDTVYVANGGGLTNSRPTGATDLVQNIGRVLRSDASQGRILVLGPGRTNDVPNSGSFSILSIKDAFTFPTTDGSAGQFLQTDGSGGLTFSSTFTDLSIIGTATYNTVEFQNSNIMKFNQMYTGASIGSYFSNGEYQKVVTIIPDGNSQNYQVIGRMTAQNAGETHTVYFNAALRSNTLPDLNWTITYDEEYNGSRYIDPQLWTKETTTAGFIFAFKTLATIYGTVTVDMQVIPRASSQKDNVTVNTVQNSEQSSVDAGYTAHDMTKVFSKKGQEFTIGGAFTFPTTDGSANQVLKTNGAGILSWADDSTAAGGIDGTGIANYVSKWADSDSLTSGIIYDDGTNIGIGTASLSYKLEVNGDMGLSDSGFYASPTGVMIGTSGWLYNDGQTTLSHGNFTDNGDAQNSSYVLRTSTTDDTFTTIQNNGSNVILASNRTMMFTANIVSRRTNGQDNAAYKIEGVLVNDGYGASILGTPVKTILYESDSSWDVQAILSGGGAGASDYLLIQGKGAASKNINWVCKLDLLEVGGDISGYTEANTLNIDAEIIP